MTNETFNWVKTFIYALGLIGGLNLTIFLYCFRDKDGLDRIIELLEENNPLNNYHKLIRTILEKSYLFFYKPWSFMSYDKILRIAIIYPIVSFLIGYGVSGYSKLGSFELLYNVSAIKRWAFVIVIIIFSFSFLYFVSIRDKIEKHLSNYIKNKHLTYILYFIVLGVFGGVGVGVGVVGGGVGGGVVFVGVVGVAVAVAVAVGVGGVVGVVGVVGVGGVGAGGGVLFLLICFYVALPLANSILDFLSFEFSRYLTEKSSKEDNKIKLLIILLLDIALAVLFLVGTAYILPFFVELYNWGGAKVITNFDVIDWKQLALIAKNDPFGEGLWITLMLFSTLFWTVIHIMIILISLGISTFGRETILNMLKKRSSPIEHLLGAIWLVGNIIISLLLVIGIPYLLLYVILDLKIADSLYCFVINYHFF